jgi:hypothetical protein
VRRLALCALALLLLAAAPDSKTTLDDFEDLSRWKAVPSDGLDAALSPTDGLHGRALRLDFDFHGHGGYVVIRRDLPLDLPENYEITFQVRGQGPPNNLEFKLIDPTNENVWWQNRRDFEPPREWTESRIKKRHIQFAWGPIGGGEIRRVAALEIAVTAGRGGRGFLLLDDLKITPLPPEHPYTLKPRLTASAASPEAGRALDGDRQTAWRAPAGPAWIALDFLERREYGGLIVDWQPGRFATRYEVQVSDDGAAWKTLRTVSGSRGGRNGKDYLYLPETDSRHLRLRLLESGSDGYGIAEIAVQPLDFSASLNALFQAIAKDAPRGLYPRAFAGEQPYWTVVGVDADTAEALFEEDGRLEIGKSSFSIEPFLFVNGKLVTWADVQAEQSLEDGDLPIPSVTWGRSPLALTVTPVAAGEPGKSFLSTRYRIANRGSAAVSARLYLAIRPFQVNPPWQFLNVPGGVAPIRKIVWDGRSAVVDGRPIVPLEPPSGFGAAPFDEGDVTDRLVRGELPGQTRIEDPFGHASAAFAWDLRLAPGEQRDVRLMFPMHAPSPTLPRADARERAPATQNFEEVLGAERRRWREKLDRVEIRLPAAAEPLVRTVRSNLAYILINRDGPGIQPGSRSYERSWIRDGALTSSALLRLGHADAARDFLVWFAGFQFANGKVPCCVDARGADPVPENDSHGEFLHLMAEYYRFTGDRETVAQLWPHAEAAVAYMESLRQQRRTDEYRRPEKLPYFGLLPESISHEGYSDRPVHSYWDDFWGLRGLADAADLARTLGKEGEAARWAAMRDEFRTDLHASVRRTIELHKLDYLPASVEKGDFDPTSTSVALAPGGEGARLPRRELLNTFERYWKESIDRRDGKREWDAYTPYELRNLRTFLRLGWRDRTQELLAFFMADRRPAAWNHWAEVVARKPREGRFLGDMPHTWVGSELIHAFLDLLAYTRAEEDALVVGAGIPPEWVTATEGVTVRNLRTEYGSLSYTVRREGEGVRYVIEKGIRVPPGGVVASWQGREVVVHTLPADRVIPR